jgi:hypothetical protein
MGTIVEYDPTQVSAANMLARSQVALSGSPLPLQDVQDRAGFFETTGSMWMQETWIGNAINGGLFPNDERPWEYNFLDTDFNPYRYYLDNRDDLMDADPWIKNGMFDDVITEGQFRDRIERLREESTRRERIANGSVLGQLAGGLLSFVDVSTFIPGVNVAKKLQTAGRVGRTAARVLGTRPAQYALAGGYYSAIQEAGLHMMQDLRTLDESVANTTAGAVFGGALGGVISGASRSSPLHPRNENYIFRPESRLVMGFKGVGESVSESAVVQAVVKNGRRTYEVVADTNAARSLSAAAREPTERVVGGIKSGAGALRNSVRAFGSAGQAAIEKTIGAASPIIRGLTSKSEAMRDATERLFDLGGILTKGHEKGVYTASVEDVAARITTEFDTGIQIRFREAHLRLQEKLAEVSPSTAGGVAGRAQRVVEGLGDAFRQTARTMRDARASRTPELLEGNKQLRAWEFEEVVRRAAHEDITDDIMQNLKGRFGDSGAEIIISAAQEMAEDIHSFNKFMEDLMIENGMITESQRMGRNYVSPQMWDGKGIVANSDRAKQFFYDLFQREPSEEFLNEYGMTPDDFVKLGNDEVTITTNGETRTLSVEEGLTARLEILEDWSGVEYNTELGRLEFEYNVAKDAAHRTRQEAIIAARDLRKTTTEIKNASVDEAVAILKARQADRAQQVRRRDVLDLSRRRAELEIRIAEAEAKARASQEPRATRDIAKLRRERQRMVKEAEDFLKMVEQDPDALPDDFRFAQEELTVADNELARAVDDGTEVARQRQAGQPITNARLQVLRDRLKRINRDLEATNTKIMVFEKKLDDLRIAAEEATTARQRLRQLEKDRRAARKKHSQEAGKAARRERVLARRLDKKEKSAPLAKYVDDLVFKLGQVQSGAMPLGMLPDTITTSGRSKMRMIKLNNDQRRAAQELGILRSDFLNTLGQGVQDVANRVAIRQVLRDYGSTEQEIMDNLKKRVSDEYNDLIRQRRESGKSTRSLEGERDRAVKDIENTIKRQLGILGLPQNPESVGWNILGNLRAYNYVRYGTGFLISSLTDLSNMVLTTGFGTFTYKNMRAVSRSVAGLNNDEIRRLAFASELLLHNSRNIKMNSTVDFRNQAGIGRYGSPLHNTTATVDQVMTGLSTATSYASGMNWWNTRLKMLAMVEMQHNLARLVDDYDRLLSLASAEDMVARGKIAQLASLGLGQDQMRNIQKMFQKYPPTETDGVLELGMSRWAEDSPAGQQAYYDVLNALDHTASRAIMTPGKGDTPFLMSNEFGKTVLQFQTYGFVIMNRYMMPAFQRMATYGDMEAFLSFAFSLALGTGVVAAKDMINQGELRERTPSQWAYDTIDRSGFLAYLSTPSAQVMRLFGEQPSRYANERNRFALVGGPTGGLVQDLWDAGDAAAYGDMERLGEVGQKLLPFKVFSQIYNVIADDN